MNFKSPMTAIWGGIRQDAILTALLIMVVKHGTRWNLRAVHDPYPCAYHAGAQAATDER